MERNRLERGFHPAAEYDRGVVLQGTIEEARSACLRAAAELGLRRRPSVEDSWLVFRDPFRWQAFPVEVVVQLSDHHQEVRVSFSGWSLGGRSVSQADYLRRLIVAFSSRVELEIQDGSAEHAKVADRGWRTPRALRLLLAVQWLPIAALLPMVALPLAIGSSRAEALMLVWFWLMLTLPSLGEVARRRLVGTGSSADYTMLAVWIGAALVCTLFFVGFNR